VQYAREVPNLEGFSYVDFSVDWCFFLCRSYECKYSFRMIYLCLSMRFSIREEPPLMIAVKLTLGQFKFLVSGGRNFQTNTNNFETSHIRTSLKTMANRMEA